MGCFGCLANDNKSGHDSGEGENTRAGRQHDIPRAAYTGEQRDDYKDVERHTEKCG